ncbi:hypothetical protein KIN34_14640 [Cellulomonas sp. DKR-3]|uniref:Trypsin-co-occurring domain-containing protein n=1 Tax=Cellulomonas fulva TaxID=2835530 RepID=A0ABS5U286_9CELL|nr:CU044_2847 family protein [Cellulomonas fulva]MBT0995521.1 hypothetical protein [Cellulomonas fulva]
MDRVVDAELGEGDTVAIAITRLEGDAGADREQDVSALTDALRFDDLARSVSQVASAMTDALRRAAPDEAEVTFGVDVAVKAGKLTSLIVEGDATATFQIRLLWKKSAEDAAER